MDTKIVAIILLVLSWALIRKLRLTRCKNCGVDLSPLDRGSLCDFCRFGYDLDRILPSNTIPLEDE